MIEEVIHGDLILNYAGVNAWQNTIGCYHRQGKRLAYVSGIKLSTSQWIKQNRDLFPQFAGWGKEYGAFTYALRDKEMVANYIKNQRVHHQRESFEEEYRKHLQNGGIEWNDYRLT